MSDEPKPAGALEKTFETYKEIYDRRWKWLIVGMWVLYAAWIVANRWGQIKGFGLGDTDDNLRMAEVRAWLSGQGWFDLRQYRFDPLHGGANIHWSRIVDLPLAGLILLFRLFVDGFWAERLAAGFAPLLPLLILMFAVAVTMRRLVSERSWALPILALLSAYSTIGMFAPMRIDHHGWQLAMLGVALAGMADPRRARGGAVMGVATGVSLSIGLEMLIYLALLGGSTVLLWVSDRDERRRMASYAAALVATTGLGFLLFASYDNRLPVCDALSPVWLSDAAVGGAVMLALAMMKLDSWKARLGAALVAGAIVAGFHALTWPHCLQRLEGVSDEANRLWLSRVREARPFYMHPWKTATIAAALPVISLFGWAVLLWRAWKRGPDGRDLLRRTAAVALPGVAAFALLFWQMRAGPPAQMLALVGAAALTAVFGKALLDAEKLWVRLGAIIVVTLSLGALVPAVVNALPDKKTSTTMKAVSKANRSCASIRELALIDRQPKGMVFTFVDLGPRLITTTHHDAVIGPYHRNYQKIVDVMKAFRGTPDEAHRIVDYYGSDYLLICPDMSTATIFMSEAPKGFYGQVVKGQVPGWLTPVDLGKGSPFLMWKVTR